MYAQPTLSSGISVSTYAIIAGSSNDTNAIKPFLGLRECVKQYEENHKRHFVQWPLPGHHFNIAVYDATISISCHA